MAATTDGPPARSLEIERTFDVDDDTPLPDWSAVAAVAGSEVRELDARYFDTPELMLGRAGYAVRRRTGGPDAGWHVKGPRVGDARVELGWPLGPEGEDVPDAVRAAVAAVAVPPFVPVARIRNTRTAYTLVDAEGGVVAEFVDDRVVATDERAGTERRWREWELELGPAATDREAFFAAATAAVFAAGGRPAASDSKLARALGA